MLDDGQGDGVFADDLALEDLRVLGAVIQALLHAGGGLQKAGLAARFRLVPGQAVAITLDYRMPMVGPGPGVVAGLAEALRDAGPVADLADLPKDGAHRLIEATQPPVVVVAPAPVVEVAPVVDVSPAPVGDVADTTGADATAGGAVVQAAASPVALPGTRATGGNPPRWSAAEDEVLVETVAAAMFIGQSKREAFASVAAELRRPLPGTEFRGKMLASRIDSRLADLRRGGPGPMRACDMTRGHKADSRPAFVTGPLDEAERATILRLAEGGVERAVIAQTLNRTVQTVALFLHQNGVAPQKVPPAPGAAPTLAPAVEAAPVVRPAVAFTPRAVTPAPRDVHSPARPVIPEGLTAAQRAVAAHLNALGHAGPWTPGLDLDLVAGLTQGRKLGEIAADLGLDSAACRDRFRALLPDTGIEQQRLLLAELRRRVAA